MPKVNYPLSVFQKAAQTVPAYKKFLQQAKVSAKNIRTIEDFSKVPIMDKKNYIYRYPLFELFPKGEVPPMIYASSGSSGKPTFWFRGDEQEEVGGKIHQRIFEKTFKINKKDSTLVIVCFSMGVWVAGNYTLSSCRYLSRNGFNLTTVTPGIEKEDILYSLQNLAPQFKNVILAGYPPFLMDIVHEAKEKGIRFKSNFFAITAGEKFSEAWRDQFLHLINAKKPEALVSIYGCADAGVLACETTFSIFLRKACLKNRALYKEFFGEEDIEPALVQFSPNDIYFETVGNELVFTTSSAVPLVRYNIHDQGKVYSVSDLARILKAVGIYEQAMRAGFKDFKLPLIVKSGRTDVAVTFYAINIYPENIKAVLEDDRISKYFSGNYFIYHSHENNHKDQILNIKLELSDRCLPSQTISDLAKKVFIDVMPQKSIEYRKLRSAIGVKADPVVTVFTRNELKVPKSAYGLLGIKGKKPKMLI